MQRIESQVVRSWMNAFQRLTKVLIAILTAALHYLVCRHPSNKSLAAEDLFLRKQPPLFQERGIKSRRADESTRAVLVWLPRAYKWRNALVIVQAATLIRWRKAGFRQYWKFKCRPGRPAIPSNLRVLIREMASSNHSGGEERIVNELLLKLGLRVSPRTVRKYMPDRIGGEPSRGEGNQNWSTFLRNHAEAIIACGIVKRGDGHLSRYRNIDMSYRLEFGRSLGRFLEDCTMPTHSAWLRDYSICGAQYGLKAFLTHQLEFSR